MERHLLKNSRLKKSPNSIIEMTLFSNVKCNHDSRALNGVPALKHVTAAVFFTDMATVVSLESSRKKRRQIDQISKNGNFIPPGSMALLLDEAADTESKLTG